MQSPGNQIDELYTSVLGRELSRDSLPQEGFVENSEDEDEDYLILTSRWYGRTVFYSFF